MSSTTSRRRARCALGTARVLPGALATVLVALCAGVGQVAADPIEVHGAMGFGLGAERKAGGFKWDFGAAHAETTVAQVQLGVRPVRDLLGFVHFGARLDATAVSISHAEWDTANAAFHETQVDLADNELLSRFYRELSVNLMMQVIRGGRLEQDEYLVTEHTAIVVALESRDRDAARAAIQRHVETGRRIALEAVERSGGTL